MSLLVLAWRNLGLAWVSTLVTALAVALAGGLMMAVYAINAQAYSAFISGAPGYDAVVGARGSPMQLVLNAVFHLDASPGNLPMSVLTELKKHPGVERVIPLAMGDNYQGFRVVGTSLDFFTDPPRRGLVAQLQPGGRWFDPEQQQAVVGSFVAQRTGLKAGATIHPSHGLAGGEAHQDEYQIVGVLQATNTPMDRVIYIPLEGVLRMDGHVLRGHGEEYHPHEHPHQEIPEEHQEVSAALLKFSGPQVGFQLDELLNRQGKEATLAYPLARVVGEIFAKLGWAHRVLELVAGLVMLVAAGGVLASIYNTLEGRRQDFLTLRALGMPRPKLLQLLVLEAGLVGALGALGSFAIYGLIVLGVAYQLRQETGLVLNVFQFHPALVGAPLGMLALAALAGLIPGWQAYRSSLAEVP